MFFLLNRMFIAILLLSLSLISGAYDFGDLRVNGYINQSFIGSSGNNYLGKSKNGSFDYGEASLNLYYRPHKLFYLSTQLVSRNISDSPASEDDLFMDYGVIGLNLYADQDLDVTLRKGRIKYPYAMYNEVHGVSNAVQSVLMPQVLYYDYFRHSNILDAKQLEANFRLRGAGSLMVELTSGRELNEYDIVRDTGKYLSTVLSDTFLQYGITLDPLNFTGYADSLKVMRFKFFSEDGDFVLGYSKTLQNTSSAVVYNSMVKYALGTSFYRETFSMEYYWDQFSVMAEKHRYKFVNSSYLDSTSYGGAVVTQRAGNGVHLFYIQGNYDYNHKWSFYLRREGLHFDEFTGAAPKYYETHKSWTFGATYMFTDNLYVRGEFHDIEGAVFLQAYGADNQDGAYDKYWDIFALQVSYSF